mgnify:CR=1 FL=1
MDRLDLKVEFEKQVKDADQKIVDAEQNLIKLKEYKTKLLGGLETLELLNPKTEGEVQEQDGPPEPTATAPDPTSTTSTEV